jgi:hypothetical protein
VLYFHCYKNGQLQAITPDSILAGAFASGYVTNNKSVEWRNSEGQQLDYSQAAKEPKYVEFDYFTSEHVRDFSDDKSWLDWRDNIEGYWSR